MTLTLTAIAAIAFAHLMAAMSPGPAFVMSVRTATSQGFGPSIRMAIGLGTGATLWALGALAGLKLLFTQAPHLLDALTYAGAIYLAYLAYKLWITAKDPISMDHSLTGARAFRTGVLTQLANPKPVIFFGTVFLTLVPQEITAADTALILAIILGNETLWYIFTGKVFSGTSARNAYLSRKHWADRAFALLLLGFSLHLVFNAA